ncbi:(1-_4)-alpha-D-glucan branching enzyme [Natronoarchaeum philippinense]|uniref:4-alpha-glucanotransferase n=1 Tax=Natronoarchaeum philippinense TaxID=558529 RepID=A0A285N4S3_NATPI|nr:4-alpha-glucanotransferase [Natronoarchaeum philippinense]SNZ04475.1 (1->4)-alpha-D-glucan branching enzyme [Natronoarchaeum philippinense]
MSRFQRQSGVYLHPTALPSRHGIGSIGAPAKQFVDAAAEAGQSLWQLCPLSPVAEVHGFSPYQAYSAFALEPLLIDLDDLVERGLLDEADVAPEQSFPEDRVDYDAVAEFKRPLLRSAYERFDEERPEEIESAFETFCERVDWLDTYALFRALKDHFDGVVWTEWPDPVRSREPEALEEYRETLADEVRYRKFLQFLAVDQWDELHAYASERGIDIVGDLPIYVAQDSADVWANPELFELDEEGQPALISGVPADGNNPPQQWGMPVYDWDAVADADYGWWIDRMDWQLELSDVVRVDHFRGFEEYYAIPADADPGDGSWREGPGLDFFRRIEDALGELPIIAEDIGFVTEEIDQLRRDIDAPGMKVLQYGDWCTEDHTYLPHTYEEDTVAYPGTHDTNTVRGWYDNLSDEQRDCLHYYLGADGEEINWELIDAAWHSDSILAVVPVQDLLDLGEWARFNSPGTTDGNWEWRCTPEQLDELPVGRLRDLTEAAGRQA